MRAVVVLLLLIANALVSPSNIEPAASPPAAPESYSLGLLATVDGSAPAAGTSDCGVRSAYDRSLAYVAPDGLPMRIARCSAPSLPVHGTESRCTRTFQL